MLLFVLSLHHQINQNKQKMLVSGAREEKFTQDVKEQQSSNRQAKLNRERIEYLESKIEEEKESIKDCLDQNFFSMAKSKVERIESMRNQIQTIQSGMFALNILP